jgi:hypothetical protein
MGCVWRDRVPRFVTVVPILILAEIMVELQRSPEFIEATVPRDNCGHVCKSQWKNDALPVPDPSSGCCLISALSFSRDGPESICEKPMESERA